MRVVRIVVWLVMAFSFLAFAAANWTPVAMIFGATEVVVRLPLLLLAVGFAGYVFASLRYRMRPRTVAAIPAAAAPLMFEPVVKHRLPSEAQPIVVPPGCG